jgi:hypothetical protein
LRGKKKIEVFTLFLRKYQSCVKENYIFRILLFSGTCPNFVDKKERLLICYKFRAFSKDFSFLWPNCTVPLIPHKTWPLVCNEKNLPLIEHSQEGGGKF